MEAGKRPLGNAEIADRLASLAQLLSLQKENPYEIKAYRRAANSIRTLSRCHEDTQTKRRRHNKNNSRADAQQGMNQCAALQYPLVLVDGEQHVR
jgi:DNA polymerase/3'-5' exonuclease PolX